MSASRAAKASSTLRGTELSRAHAALSPRSPAVLVYVLDPFVDSVDALQIKVTVHPQNLALLLLCKFSLLDNPRSFLGQ